MSYIKKLKEVDLSKVSKKVGDLVQRTIDHFDEDLATKKGIDGVESLYNIITENYPDSLNVNIIENGITHKISDYAVLNDYGVLNDKTDDCHTNSDTIIEQNSTDVITAHIKKQRGRPRIHQIVDNVVKELKKRGRKRKVVQELSKEILINSNLVSEKCIDYEIKEFDLNPINHNIEEIKNEFEKTEPKKQRGRPRKHQNS